MAISEVINNSSELLPGIVLELGRLGKWLQAIGIVILLWLIFQIISLIMGIKKNNKLKDIQNRLSKLERKLDKGLGKK
ncbi:MAG: hypothetical protein ABIH59_03705 [archaeon]